MTALYWAELKVVPKVGPEAERMVAKTAVILAASSAVLSVEMMAVYLAPSSVETMAALLAVSSVDLMVGLTD
jgi:hypothetical protein